LISETLQNGYAVVLHVFISSRGAVPELNKKYFRYTDVAPSANKRTITISIKQ
jgi:hypothetical protein